MKLRQRIVRAMLGLPAGLLFLLAAPAAHALSITLPFTVEFSGPGPGISAPSGPTPWAVVTFDDAFGSANTVRLFMSTPNLSGGTKGENISDFLFNFDPSLDPTQLLFTAVDDSASVPNNIFTGVDSFMANGDGLFDIRFDFPPPPGSAAARFTGGETIIYDLTYVSPITATSFNHFSFMDGGGQGSFLAAALVMSTPNGGDDSGWIGAIPEPGTAGLMGLGLALLGARRRRAARR